uniref:Transposase IS200-like domain-containing protein n=1 Tax=Solibacter usitatus (strain Ellin6076) TaxID=234267 RepID=Q01VQ7_SOLUE
MRSSPQSPHELKVTYRERRLPHWDLVEHPVFVTFRLHNSLPAGRVFPTERLTSGKAFVALDRVLDTCTSGPLYLRMPEIAAVVVNSLRGGEMRFGRYQMHSFVVMPNHVHLLVTPHVVATQWLGPLKGFIGYKANRILTRSGPFWQDESYDHLVRSDAEFDRIREYIENNPVKAALVSEAQQWIWSSAAHGEEAA